MIGETVSHYKILDRLGGGGMGEVYKAEDTKLGRHVALKFLPPEVSESEEALERFLREARAAASLSHPHICTIHEIEEHEGVPFIVMEYLEGRNLRHAVALRPLAVDTVVELGIQITEALAVAHGKGIIHRDIKPSNIFLTETAKVKVLDFGLAKLARQLPAPGEDETIDAEAPTRTRDLTSDGTAVGTVAYMSPEQALGQPVDVRTDIFSLGAVLYEMVTGQQAFTGPTQAAIFDKILNRVPPSPARLGVDLPYELEQIIFKALEKDKVLRYQSALEMHTDLRRLRRDLESGRSGAAVAASGAAPATSPASDSSQAVVAARPEGATAVEPASAQVPAAASPRRHSLIPSLVGLLAVVAVAAVIVWQGKEEEVLAESDEVLLTDFVNTTADPVFDGTLKQALAVKLEESPFLNIVPERQVRETLQFMGRAPDEAVSPETGQEICERQGIKALVGGEIASLGSNYVVTVTAQECRTGKALAREQVEAASKEQVLGAVGQAASEVRRELGESLSSIQRFDAPVEQATTSSLEALKAFSLGVEARAQRSGEDAIPFFRRALELDPEFAMAHARLGAIYGNLDESQLSSEHKRRAFELRDRVSEPERLYITAHYYAGVTGDLHKAIETYALWKQIYPREWTAPNNIASAYLTLGQFEKALEEAERAVELAPDNPIPYTNLGQASLYLGRIAEAKRTYGEALAREFGYVALFVDRYAIAYLESDEETMQQQLEALAGKPGEARILESQAAAAASGGRLQEARELYRRGIEVAQLHGFDEKAALLITEVAEMEAAFGNLERAGEEIRDAMRWAHTRDTLAAAAVTLTRLGGGQEAETLIAELEERFPGDTLVGSVWIPLARAARAIERGSYDRAVEHLEAARPYDRRYPWVIFLRGQAYLMSGAAEKAVAEFERLRELRGVDAVEPVHTMAHLGLARAHAASGNNAASHRAYEAFFARLEDADDGLALLQQARAEYQAL